MPRCERVAIRGIAELPQGKGSWPSTMALHEALVLEALADAKLGLADVDVLLTVEPRSDPYLIHAAALGERLGIAPETCISFEAGGGAPVLMMQAAQEMLQAGRGRTAVVVAADLPLTGVTRDRYVSQLAQVGPVHPEFEVPYAPSVPSMFALVASRYLHLHGGRPDMFWPVARHCREMAARHPNAHMRAPLTHEAYTASRSIADPLRLLDCAPVSDGGGALVLTAADAAGNPWPDIVLAGVGSAGSQLHLSKAASLDRFDAGQALDRALARAGVARSDIDVALIYDCFTVALAMNMEDMGLAPRGEAAALFESGRFGLSGGLPVNTHGGLLSHGHPARAGGMGNVIEAIVQLRQAGGERQVSDCGHALVHGMGGVFANHAVAILARRDA